MNLNTQLFLACALLSALAAIGAPAEAQALTADHLRCEYRESPMGIDTPKPRLSWWLESAGRGERQRAYQIAVASSPENLESEQFDLWDSGRVESNRSVLVEYDGRPLASEARCWWKVRVWDRRGRRSDWSWPAAWTMGLLHPADWEAQRIAATPRLCNTKILASGRAASDPANAAVMLRKEFRVDGAVRRATAYLCGLGYSELQINGGKIGDHVLDPGFTDFSRRALYVTCDVTQAIRDGGNAVGILLGGGWFNLATPDLFGDEHAPWSASPRAILRLVI